jgi:hypothetical protein
MTVILASWETEVRRIAIGGQSRQIVHETPICKRTNPPTPQKIIKRMQVEGAQDACGGQKMEGPSLGEGMGSNTSFSGSCSSRDLVGCEKTHTSP